MDAAEAAETFKEQLKRPLRPCSLKRRVAGPLLVCLPVLRAIQSTRWLPWVDLGLEVVTGSNLPSDFPYDLLRWVGNFEPRGGYQMGPQNLLVLLTTENSSPFSLFFWYLEQRSAVNSSVMATPILYKLLSAPTFSSLWALDMDALLTPPHRPRAQAMSWVEVPIYLCYYWLFVLWQLISSELFQCAPLHVHTRASCMFQKSEPLSWVSA